METNCQVVNIALSVKTLKKIEDYQIQHIFKAIIDYVLSKMQLQIIYQNLSITGNINQVLIAAFLVLSSLLFLLINQNLGQK